MKLPGKLEGIIAFSLIVATPSTIGAVLSYRNGSTLEAGASLANLTALMGYIRYRESQSGDSLGHTRIG
ncbi:MAG: hypothetical protein KKG75_05650 [Nanoarchaeota archaeon]|nr:hypothetical protein [Nanoarchaeota archaeon]